METEVTTEAAHVNEYIGQSFLKVIPTGLLQNILKPAHHVERALRYLCSGGICCSSSIQEVKSAKSHEHVCSFGGLQ